MKYVVTADQKFYFDKHHSIEFENLLSEKELALLKKEPLSSRDSMRTNLEVKKLILFIQNSCNTVSTRNIKFLL